MSDRDEIKAPARQATLELARADIGFAAAHFSIVDGKAERLHGHNYRVRLRARGALRKDGSLIDFSVLKTALRMACAELDERMLVPISGHDIEVRQHDHEVIVQHASRRYVFPREDVRLLPIANTTCECLATYILGEVRAGLGAWPIDLELYVEESPGQGASAAE